MTMKDTKSENMLKCTDCSRKFLKLINLQVHEQWHAKIKLSVCSGCNETFSDIKNLEFHKNFKCTADITSSIHLNDSNYLYPCYGV